MQINCSVFHDFCVVRKAERTNPYLPYLRCNSGDKVMWCPSPLHGRSFVVGMTDNGRYIVSKGNGLCYTQHTFLHTGEFFDGTWGLLLRQDAERDFVMGIEIEALGIKTNHMEYVLELEKEVALPNGHRVKPCLLQYDVECPYRICDAAFMTQSQIQVEVEKWQGLNDKGFNKNHLIAANMLIHNLKVLHDHDILHNAISEQNYTWALELLDFELACSPKHPYKSEDDRRHVKDLFPREVLQTYVVINYIAGVLREEVDYSIIDALFSEYGFDLNRYSVEQKELYDSQEVKVDIPIDLYQQVCDEIVALGREVWGKFPSLQKLNEFIEHQEQCHCVINTITADDEFAGFAIMLRLSTREGEIYEYDAMYACMTAIKQKFRNHGLGERLLRHVTNSYDCPVIVTSNPFIGAADKKLRMRAFYEQSGFERTPMGWTDNEQNEYDVFVKGQMDMEAWVAVSERVQELWHDIETI